MSIARTSDAMAGERAERTLRLASLLAPVRTKARAAMGV